MFPDTLEPQYHIRRVAYGSSGFWQHHDLVLATYKKAGFVPELSTSLADSYDRDTAAYYNLHTPHGDESLSGTFRILEPSNGHLPALALCSGHAILGPVHRLCESTRVVSARRHSLGGKMLTQSVLFEAVIRALAYVRNRELWAMVSLGSPQIFEWINATFCNTQRALSVPQWYEGGMVIPSIIWRDEFERVLATEAPHILRYYHLAVAEESAR